MGDNVFLTQKIFDSESILAAGSATSSVIDLKSARSNGYFSLQVALTGDGTAKIEYELSNSGGDYITPTGSSDIVTALIKTSGPGTDGKNIYSFEPMLANKMRIKVTETGGADAVVISAWLAVQ